MSDQKTAVTKLSAGDLEGLTDEQLRQTQGIFLKRLAKRARGVVSEALSGKEQDIIRALTTPPFTYTTPDLKVGGDMVIKLQTLSNDQVADAYRQVDKFMSEEDANNMRVTNELNLALLSHSLVKLNGSDFGDVDLPENYHEIVRADPKAAKSVLEQVRERRRAELGAMPMSITSRLVEFYLAMQMAVDAAANSENLSDLLGN